LVIILVMGGALFSCVGCDAQFCCEHYGLYLRDVLCPFSFDDMLSVIDSMSLSYADVGSELAWLEMASRDCHVSTTGGCSFIEFLCTV